MHCYNRKLQVNEMKSVCTRNPTTRSSQLHALVFSLQTSFIFLCYTCLLSEIMCEKFLSYYFHIYLLFGLYHIMFEKDTTINIEHIFHKDIRVYPLLHIYSKCVYKQETNDCVYISQS